MESAGTHAPTCLPPPGSGETPAPTTTRASYWVGGDPSSKPNPWWGVGLWKEMPLRGVTCEMRALPNLEQVAASQTQHLDLVGITEA